MKIEGPGRTGQTGKAGKTGKASKADGSFEAYVSGGASEAAAPAATKSIAKVDALLAVQGAEDPTERAAKQRMRVRADNLLKELDKIRIALSVGTLTVGHVIDIADVVASHREKFTDPTLTAILDEIDLRAQIEIAKIQKTLDSEG